jgi:hypothetical protein
MTGKYLITTDAWFYAPDGNSYRAVWGTVTILEDNVLGIKTNRNSSNWYVKIGSDAKHVIIAGCQIHYAVRCDEMPNNKTYQSEVTHELKVKTVVINATRIYIAE